MVLDFGERLFVEGRDGCRRFSGFAVLDGDEIRLDGLDFDLSNCAGSASALPALTDQPVWRATLLDQALLLAHGDTRLLFAISDWR